MKRLLSLLLLLNLAMCAMAQYENHWNPNPYQFANNMTIVGVINFNGIEQHSESIELGAFCGDECRGSVIANYEEYYDRYYMFMMIYGNSGDSISFRCYDHKINMELDMIQETFIEFQANDMLGGIVDPFIFSFKSYQHEITLDILPEIGGNAIGEGIYNKYDTCYIEMNPNSGYQFDALVENEDTLTKQNHYSFIVLSDRHFKAHFSEKPIYYQITAEADPSIGGVINGIGEYLEEETCTLQISTNAGYTYEGLYENGQLVTSDNVFSFVAEADRHFVAKFSVQINYYQISADISPNNAGTIAGLGAYQEGENCVLEISANEGYYFVALKENDEIISEEPNYSFVVDNNHHFVAEFALKEFEISLSANPEEGGTVSGGGTFTYGSTVYAIANPNNNYIFLNWTNEDGTILTTNPQYVFEVTKDINLIANFAYYDAITENTNTHFTIYPNPTSDFITIDNDNVNQVTIYDMSGKVVIKKNLDGDNRIYVGNLSKGTYAITFNDGLSRCKLIINK